MTIYPTGEAARTVADEHKAADPGRFYLVVATEYDARGWRGKYAVQVVDPTADLSGPQETWPEPVFL
jgi:hypothetical protein